MKTVAIIAARMGSTRLPGKVLRDLAGRPVLRWVWNAVHAAEGVDEVVIATTTEPADDAIARYCEARSMQFFRGSETDVLGRFFEAATHYDADIVLRITGDCPFVDPGVIGQVLALRKAEKADYASNISPPSWPDGLDVEAMTFEALELADFRATSKIDRDCLTQYIERNQHRFSHAALVCPLPGLHKERWVLDTENDFRFCEEIARRVRGTTPSHLEILSILDKEPHLREINQMHPRNERFFDALADAPLMVRSYTQSRILLERAEETIPLAAQTFSKSKVQFPANNPLFLSHGQGAYVFDVDGHEYVDMMGALLPNILGYRDPDVDWAIREQLSRGISFSLATELEVQLADKLKSIIPCAEMVRFGKTGTDVTSAAVRLARAYTGRDAILSAGYHGWADWAIGNDEMRGRGVPNLTKALTNIFRYGDKDHVFTCLNTKEYAAVIVEPEKDKEFLKFLRHQCDATGTLLIFDEIITGFRWPQMSAQRLYDVTPDLACFGKAMGNGMPISAIVGRRDVMKLMEPPNNIFYSGTFFGETLSLAAALATIKKLEDTHGIGVMFSRSIDLSDALRALQNAYGLETVVEWDHTPLNRISFNGTMNATKEQLGALFRQEMAQAGVLIVNANALSFAHNEPELRRVRRAYEHTFKIMSAAIKDGNISELIGNAALPAGANVRV